MNTIYLIGFMGAGKTTIGKELSKEIGYPVIDTDEEIVRTTNMTINDIFEKHGEGYFRKLEEKTLQAIVPKGEKGLIVTTGGGIIMNKNNRQWMKEHGKVIFLYCHPDEIFRRLKNDTTRPLLKSNKQQSLQILYQERLPIYEEVAHVTVDTTNKNVSEIAKEISHCLVEENLDIL